MVKKFVKKPIIIEAGQVAETQLLTFEHLPFCEKAQYNYSVSDGFAVYDELHRTWVKFDVGDWIIKGIKGEFYPCKPDIFEQTYEEVKG